MRLNRSSNFVKIRHNLFNQKFDVYASVRRCHRSHKEAYVEEKCETHTSQGMFISTFLSKSYDANCIDSKMINLSFQISMVKCLAEQCQKNVSISFIAGYIED